MNPVVAAFGTALVGAIATDAWQQVCEAITGLCRRVHPRREDDGIGAELDELRKHVLAARRDGDANTERALEGAWQLRLQQLLRADPALAAELQRARYRNCYTQLMELEPLTQRHGEVRVSP